jgi:competence protein ComEC
VTVLVLFDPWLARSIGFALSCAATAGIIVLARVWAYEAAGWMPRPLAAALAVPLAAQLACTPLLVGMTGEVSLSALPANLLAAPAVPPATVLGVAAALVGLVAPPAASVIAGVGMLPTGWIVLVAQRCADLPGTVVGWTWGVPLAVVASFLLALVVPYLLRSPVASLAACMVLGVLLVRPAAGWPPADWLMVACDVGQGDALVLRSGPGEAVVVDTGPDPAAIDGCLDDLGVRSVPLMLLSHFDADHVAGVDGVTRGRTVSRALVTVVDEPAAGAASAARWAADAGVALERAWPGQGGRVGGLTWTVLWPERVIRGAGSTPNQASLVARVEVDGVSVLLTGDIEPEAQRAIGPIEAVDVDVLKVPHHGASLQDHGFLAATSPAVAVVSVGADNTYGHPGRATLALLDNIGAVTVRTDTDGDTAIIRTEGPRGPSSIPQIAVVRRGSW